MLQKQDLTQQWLRHKKLISSLQYKEQNKNATLGKSAGGIYNAMYWTDDTGTPHNVSLTSAQEYDEQGYNDAMDKYNVNKQNNEKKITDNNSKTEQLQQTDRTLEL